MAKLSVITNAAELARRMQRRADRVNGALESAAREAARLLNRETKETLQQEIYNQPIPRTKTGRPKWVRTGRLQRAEMARADGAHIVLRNATRYALYRHRLGTPQGRRIRSEGVRSIQWHDRVVDQQRDKIQAIRRRAVIRVLREG